MFEGRKNTISLNCIQDLAQISFIYPILYGQARLGTLKSLSYKSVKVSIWSWDHPLVLQTWFALLAGWFSQKKVSDLSLHQA